MNVPPRVHVVGEQRASVARHLAARYQALGRIDAVAAEVGRSYAWVRVMLHESGAPVGAGHRPMARCTPEETARVVAVYARTRSMKAVVAELGLGRRVVARTLTAAGVRLRRGGKPTA